MSDSSGKLTITFNGEIYNYRELRQELSRLGHEFRTESDTEVILEAYRRWGDDCLDHFDGMFAFALYDKDKDRLFAARDRAGEKPFFYWHHAHALTFASELKGLMQHPHLERRADVDAINFYLAYGYVPNDLCILQGVRKLPPGHALVYERQSDLLRVWPFWKLPDPPREDRVDPLELVEEYRTLLTDSVRRQLVADVPVGILLSGGMDSSLITAIACQVSSKPIKAFTISFPEHERYDEGPYARFISDHFGIEHRILPAEKASVDLLPELARQFDEPIADSSMIPTLLISRLIRKHVTVGIGGDGGDELFGGYPHYSWLRRLGQVRRIIPDGFRNQLARIGRRVIPVGVHGRGHLIGLEGGIERSLSSVNLFFDDQERHALFLPLREISSEGSGPERFKGEMSAPGISLLQKATSMDFRTYLPDDLLVKVDRASMLASLEIRAPFLDRRLINFAYSRVPDSLRVRGGKRKILSRLLAKQILPRGFDLGRKQGFVVPLASWFREGWGDQVKSVLLETTSWFNKPQVAKLIQGQERGLANTQRLFALMMVELWRREYQIQLPS